MAAIIGNPINLRQVLSAIDSPEAIYGSRYWKESGQADEDLAFTTRGKKLYAIKLKKPTAPFVISGTAGWGRGR